MDDYTEFSNEDLAQAVRLLVRPEWISDRAVMIAILRALDFTPEVVRKQLASGKPLHDEPQLLI